MALAWAPMCLRVQLLPITKGSHWARPNKQTVRMGGVLEGQCGHSGQSGDRSAFCHRDTHRRVLHQSCSPLHCSYFVGRVTMSQMWGPAGQLVHAFGGALGKQFQVGALLQEGLGEERWVESRVAFPPRASSCQGCWRSSAPACLLTSAPPAQGICTGAGAGGEAKGLEGLAAREDGAQEA